MRIVNNLPAVKALRQLERNNKSLSKTLRSLSTGLRINSSADDAAGFAISQRMRSQISCLNVAARNIQDGISMLQTAECSLGNINSMLQRMRDLAVQASNDTLSSQDRYYVQLEINELKSEIDRISKTASFNNKKLLDGSCGASWSSDNPGIKARINGDIGTSEGTYRIDFSVIEQGKPQVQASNIMLIKHDNVIINKTINYSSGINDINVSNIPQGSYHAASSLPAEARAVLTGSYGINFDELEKSINANVRSSYLQNNASILFEVSDVQDGSITLNATANILAPDGTTDTVSQSNITLTNGKFIDLSEILNLGRTGSDETKPDGAFELELTNPSAFSAGDKFVYNLNAFSGTDRSININTSNTQSSSSAPEETAIIQKTNTFKPKEPLPSAAKVVFLIDNSGSMGPSFQTVKNCVSSFLESIRNEGADDIKIGVARYLTNGITNTSYDWYTTEEELINSLQIQLLGGAVDPYKAVTDVISKYDMSDVAARHIVLITDTGQEVPSGGTLTSAQQALSSAGVTLSAVSNGSNAIKNLITGKGIDLRINDADWGNKLVNDLGQKIGRDAITSAINNTPLSGYKQFEGLFPDASSPARTITITTDSGTASIEIAPSDTMSTIAEKLSTASGVSAGIDYSDDPDDGERGLSISLTLQYTSELEISGDKELVNIMGLRSNYDLAFGINSELVKGKDLHFRNFYVDGTTGQVSEGDIILSTGTEHLEEYALIGKFDASSAGRIAAGDVKLRDINNFWNSEGIFVLDAPQRIMLTQGDGRTAELMLYGTDTLNDLCAKLNEAIGTGLGQMKYADSNNFVKLTSDGKLIINSAVPGQEGEIYFSGSEGILEGLGLNTIELSSEAKISASVYDAVRGRKINEGEADGAEFVSLIPPEIDIKAECMSGLSANWNENTQRFMLAGRRVYSAILSLKNNGTVFQAGANENEIISVKLCGMTCYELGLEGVNVLTRENASRAVSVIDRAIIRAARQRAKGGADNNALEAGMNNLAVMGANLLEAESRIRDADMAETMLLFVKKNILTQTGTSMLAQSNQLPKSIMGLMQ